MDRCTEAECIPCNPNCLTCSNGTDCDTCYGIRENAPACTCPDGYYSDDLTGECHLCNDICETCDNATTCKKCKPNTFRENPELCLCMDGYFDAGVPVCEPCHGNCLTCEGTAINCKECNDPRDPIPNCPCPDGMWDNAGVCEDCSYICNICHTSATDCPYPDCAGNRVGTTCECPEHFYENGVAECPECGCEC